MADARIAVAAAAALLMLLAAAAIRPTPARAQQTQDQETSQTPPSETQGTPDATSLPGAAGGGAHLALPQPPLITMTAVPGYGPAPLTVGFFVNTVDPEGKSFVSYLWNFGDGQVSMAPPLMFFHTYRTAGSYVATVNATTSDGRTATAYVGVIVRPPLFD